MVLDCMAFYWVGKLAFQEGLESTEETTGRDEVQSGLDVAMGSIFRCKHGYLF